MEHPVSESCLERFVFGKTSPAENRSMVAHLLSGCGNCSRKLAKLLRPEVPTTAYDAMFRRVETSVADTWGSLRREDLVASAR